MFWMDCKLGAVVLPWLRWKGNSSTISSSKILSVPIRHSKHVSCVARCKKKKKNFVSWWKLEQQSSRIKEGLMSGRRLSKTNNYLEWPCLQLSCFWSQATEHSFTTNEVVWYRRDKRCCWGWLRWPKRWQRADTVKGEYLCCFCSVLRNKLATCNKAVNSGTAVLELK